MGDLLTWPIERPDIYRVAASGGHTLQLTAAREDHGPRLAPAPGIQVWPGPADVLHATTGNANSLELAAGEERDVAAVGRPEWGARTLGARQRFRNGRVDSSHVQGRTTRRRRRRKRNPPSVRRDRKIMGIRKSWSRDDETHLLGRGRCRGRWRTERQ